MFRATLGGGLADGCDADWLAGLMPYRYESLWAIDQLLDFDLLVG